MCTLTRTRNTRQSWCLTSFYLLNQFRRLHKLHLIRLFEFANYHIQIHVVCCIILIQSQIRLQTQFSCRLHIPTINQVSLYQYNDISPPILDPLLLTQPRLRVNFNFIKHINETSARTHPHCQCRELRPLQKDIPKISNGSSTSVVFSRSAR